MEKPIDVLISHLTGIHASNISPAVIDSVKISYHGQATPIKHVAHTESTKAGIVITPYESGILNSIVQALNSSGFNSYVYSKSSAIASAPKPNKEDMAKVMNHIKRLGEDAKIAIRGIRKNFRQGLSSDELKQQEKTIQKITDDYIGQVDSIVKSKIEKITN